MPATKIIFDEDDFKYMTDYKDATGVSIQRFVTNAIKEHRLKLEAEQYIKDSHYTDSTTLINDSYHTDGTTPLKTDNDATLH